MTKHREQLESVLDYLINGELTEAEDLLHRVVIEKSKNIYESLISEEECDDDEDLEETKEVDEEDELDEGVGGDPRESYADEIEANKKKVKSEEFHEADEEYADDEYADDENEIDFDLTGDDAANDDEFGAANDDEFGAANDDEFGDEEGFDDIGDSGEIVDRMEDIEAALAELTAEFHEVFADELGDEFDDEDEMSDMGELDYEDDAANDDEYGDMEDGAEYDDYDEEEDEYDRAVGEALEEATAFLKQAADAGMKSEGNEVAAGKTAPVNTKSVHDTSKRKDYGGSPVDFAGGDEKGGKATSPKDENAEDNVKVPQKSAPKVQTKPVGDDKANIKSLLTGAPGAKK